MFEKNKKFEYTLIEQIFLAIKNPESMTLDNFKEITTKLNLEWLITPLFFPINEDGNIWSENDPSFNPEHTHRFNNYGSDFLDFIAKVYNHTNINGRKNIEFLVNSLYSSYKNEELFTKASGYEKLFTIYEKILIGENLDSEISHDIMKKRI